MSLLIRPVCAGTSRLRNWSPHCGADLLLADLIKDRVRLINRMHGPLAGICPALERAFDYSAAKGPVVMLAEYQTPAALRRIDTQRLTSWRERREVRSAAKLTAKPSSLPIPSSSPRRPGPDRPTLRRLHRQLPPTQAQRAPALAVLHVREDATRPLSGLEPQEACR